MSLGGFGEIARRKLRNPAGGCGLSGDTIFRVHLPSEAVLPPSSCTRTHAVHGRIQLYCTAVQDSCTVTRHRKECDVIRHVITGAGRQNDKKNLRRKEEGWPRTGTFFAPWGCMPVMDGPIFNRLQLGMAFYRQVRLYFPRVSNVLKN